MSVADAAEARHEIIIVRRSHDDHDDAHHGGVWKIAFADFMTAMMCFFLVMWLINAANEQTKAAVASYFNPVKLVDRNASRKGLEDLGDGPSKVGPTADDPSRTRPSKSGQDGSGAAARRTSKQVEADSVRKTDLSDQHLFADPYAVLSEIATDTGVMQNVSQKGDGGAQNAGPATGASGGASYRDPFAPDFWSQQVAAPGAEASAERTKIEGDPVKPGDKVAKTQVPKVKAVPPAPPVTAAPLEPLAKVRGRTRQQPQNRLAAQGRSHEGRSRKGRDRQGRSREGRGCKAQEAAKPDDRRKRRRPPPPSRPRPTSSSNWPMPSSPATSCTTASRSRPPTRASSSRSPTSSISACSRSARRCRAANWCWRWKRSAASSTARRAPSASTATPMRGRSAATPTTIGGCPRRAPIPPTTCSCAAASTSAASPRSPASPTASRRIAADPMAAANRRIEILMATDG